MPNLKSTIEHLQGFWKICWEKRVLLRVLYRGLYLLNKAIFSTNLCPKY